MGSSLNKRRKDSTLVQIRDPKEINIHLNFIGEGQIQMLKEKFDKYGKNGLTLKDFKKTMPYITTLPSRVIENAFLKFINPNTQKITLEAYCSSVSKYMLGSRENKCDFLYQIFNTSNNGQLNRTEAQLLDSHLNRVSSYIEGRQKLLSLLNGAEFISYHDFISWAYENIHIHKALQPFEIIPSPNSEKDIYMKSMENFKNSGFKNNEFYYLISASWFKAWSSYVALETSILSSNIISYKPRGRPHAISNSDLLDQNTEKLRPNLKCPEDFLVFPKNIWQEFFKWYGGGPKILRQAIKINEIIDIELYPPLFKIYYQKTINSAISEKPIQTFISITENVQSILEAVKSKIFEDEDLGVFIKNNATFRFFDKNTKISDLELKDINLCVVIFMINSNGREIYIEINEDDLDFTEGDNVEYKSMGQWILARVKKVNSENFVLENRGKNIINVSKSEIGRLRRPKLEMLVNKKDYLFCGIRNIKGSCAINAVLQVLFYTPLINEFFSNENFCKTAQELKYYHKEIFEFGKMFNDLKDTNKTLIDPSNFIIAFGQVNGNQSLNDAHEFLQNFLNNLHQAFYIPNEPQYEFLREVNCQNLEEETKAKTQWEKYLESEGSIITKVFGLQKKTSKVCLNCNNYRSTFEVSNDVSIQIPSSQNSIISLIIVTRNCLYLKKLTIEFYEQMTLEKFIIQVDDKSPVRYTNLIFAYVNKSMCGNCFLPTGIEDLRQNNGSELYGFEIITSINDGENIGTFIAKHRMHLNWRNNLQINELVDYYYNGRWEFAHIKRLSNANVDIVIHVNESKEEFVAKNDANLEFYRNKTVSANEILVIPIIQYQNNNEGITPFSTPCMLSIGCWYTWYDLRNELKRICQQFCDKNVKVESITNFYLCNIENGICQVCRSNHRECEIPDNFETLERLANTYKNLRIKIVWKNTSFYENMKTETLLQDETYSLQDCLLEYIQEVQREMDCHICFKPRHLIKSGLWEVPEILTIHLNRSAKNFSGQIIRTNAFVKFPLTNFDIRNMMTKVIDIGQTVNDIKSNYLYDLYAIIDYRKGNTSGHYTAYCKTQNSEWLHFDDDKVNIINKDYEEEIVTSRAYILFYKRQKFKSANIVRQKQGK